MNKAFTLGLVAALAAIAACASDPPPAPAYVPPNPTSLGCALGVKGTRVAVADVNNGVQVTLITDSNIGDLRARAHQAAELHGQGAHAGLGHNGQHGLGDGRGESHGLRLWTMPPLHASVTDVDNGAQMTLESVDPGQRAELRTKVRKRVDELALAPCD